MALPDLAGLGLLLVLAGAADAAGPDAGGGAAPSPTCTLSLAATPASLEPGDARTVRLRLVSPGPPRLAASVGLVEGLRPVGDWDWEATWTAPPAGIPEVALLTALAGQDCGHLAVPLTGSGDAVVRTRAGASVLVHIAERPFGPVVADLGGVALVPVEVPPGVDAVFHGKRRIPLDVPPVAHLALAADAADAPADREVIVPLLLVAVDPGGAPHRGAPPPLTASAGVVGPLVPAGPGAWRTTWRLPAGPAAPVTLTGRLLGEPAVELRLPRPAGAPAAVQVRPARPAARAGDAPLLVSVALRDAAGNPADGPLELGADAGQVGPVERLGAGEYRAAWTAPTRLDGRRRALLTARAGALQADAAVALRPAAPARLTLGAAATEVTADGRAAMVVHASVEDAFGNPVSEPPTRASAAAGHLGPPLPDGPGRFRLTYRPRPVTALADDEVAAELPPLAARLHLTLRPPLPRFSVAASAGLALRPGGWLGLQAGGEVSAWRWLVGQEAGLALSAAFSRFRDTSTVAAGAGSASFVGEVQVLALLASAAWRRTLGRQVPLRLEAGGGLARVESRVAVGGGPLLPEAGWVPAASAAASVGFSTWRGRAVLALRATWLADAGLDSLRGAVSPVSLSLGYELDAP